MGGNSRSRRNGFVASFRRLLGMSTDRTRVSKKRLELSRTLSCESLESRQMCATDLGSISGVVFRDLNNNGVFNSGTDQAIQSAEIRLFNDANNNGAIDTGEAQVGSPQTTNSSGMYSFSGLTAGSYVVRQIASSSLGIVQRDTARVITATQAQGTITTTVDNFTTTSGPATDNVVDGTAVVVGTTGLPTTETIGGARRLIAELTAGRTPPDASVQEARLVVAGGNLNEQLSSQEQGQFTVIWDGQGGTSTTPNLSGTGLNGAALNSGGATGLVMRLVAVDQPGNSVTIRVYTDATNFSEATQTLPQITGSAPPQDLFFSFAGGTGGFTNAGGTGANFGNVRAIQMVVNSTANGTDFDLDLTGALGPTVIAADVANPSIDLSVNKTLASVTNLANGDKQYTFNVNVTNAATLPGGGAGATATGVTLTDTLPSGLTFVSATGSPATSPAVGSSGNIVWNIGTLNAGATSSFQVVARTNGPILSTNNTTALTDSSTVLDPLRNRATVTANESEANTENNTASLLVPTVDLELTKSLATGSSSTPDKNANVTFNIVVTNRGPNAATNAVVRDYLPTGLTFVSQNSTPPSGTNVTFNSATNSWTIDTLASGATVTLSLTATVASPGTQANNFQLTNVAEIISDDQYDIDSRPGVPGTGATTPTEDDLGSVVLTPGRTDLAVTKQALVNGQTATTVNRGQQVTFNVTVTNNGPNNATGVTLNDTLPAGFTLVSSTPPTGTTYTNGVWNIGALNNGQSVTLAIVATANNPSSVTGTDPYKNTATISGMNQFDTNNSNDMAMVTVTPTQTDVQVTKEIVSGSRATVGQNVTFRITARNNGPQTATNVVVRDLLPDGLQFVSSTAGTAYNSTTGDWTVGTLQTSGTGQSATMDIVATVTSTGTKTNTATLQTDQLDQFDSVSTNNSQVVTLNPAITKRLFLARRARGN